MQVEPYARVFPLDAFTVDSPAMRPPGPFQSGQARKLDMEMTM